ncbi:hypothetical protein [Vagococcus fluvialis]|uniref:DUF3997 domain-containing protein n=1 Tax=Vagococcus fluvialis bH819 TaxID=1255619 RepID=A0A1X6WTT8_9ENTE|nr:hypothetical protein [Vagococcus fluvialis]SLM87036.1 hypothetical protein FM121_13140 [Vagococcus fluvialis bH819]
MKKITVIAIVPIVILALLSYIFYSSSIEESYKEEGTKPTDYVIKIGDNYTLDKTSAKESSLVYQNGNDRRSMNIDYLVKLNWNDNYIIYSKKENVFKRQYCIIQKVTGDVVYTTSRLKEFEKELKDRNIEKELLKLSKFDWYLP